MYFAKKYYVRVPVVRHGLHQARVDHPEVVGEPLERLHGVLVSQIISSKDDPDVLTPVHSKGAPQDVDCSIALQYYLFL